MNDFLGGALAGLAVDSLLFPIDTIKTRLQAINSNSYKNLYSGIKITIVSSAPSAAIFFLTYKHLSTKNIFKNDNANHIASASIAETLSCLIRVPSELFKQRLQVDHTKSFGSIWNDVYAKFGFGGFYRGFAITMFREIPFVAIQFPFFHFLKTLKFNEGLGAVDHVETAILGGVAGLVAGGLTTPFDVIKTRTMLSDTQNINSITKQLYNEAGFGGFFKGVIPRCIWISIGGFIFLGTYELVVKEVSI